MQCHLSLARFSQSTFGDGTPVWVPPPSAIGVIDLTPPGLDSEPDVNYALVASTEELDSEYLLAHLGFGDPRDLHLTGKTVNLWDDITGFRPQAGTVSNALAQTFMEGGDPTGRNFVRPLSGVNGPWLHIWLAGEIVWASVLSDKNQAHAMKVIQGELQSLRDLYADRGEAPYRKALWVLGRKYNLKGGVNDWLPANDPTLPRLEPVVPSTIKTETWPTNGTFTAAFSQDNNWEVLLTGATVNAGTVTGNGAATYAIRLDYDFGGNDLTATFVNAVDSVTGYQSPTVRMTAHNNWYGGITFSRAAGELRLYKNVTGTLTQLSTSYAYGAVPTLQTHIVGSRATGTTIDLLVDGVAVKTATDSAIASGTRCGLFMSAANQKAGQWTGDDGIVASSSSSSSSSSGTSSSSSSSSSSAVGSSSSSAVGSSSSSAAPASSSYPDCRLTAGWYRDWCRRREVRW